MLRFTAPLFILTLAACSSSPALRPRDLPPRMGNPASVAVYEAYSETDPDISGRAEVLEDRFGATQTYLDVFKASAAVKIHLAKTPGKAGPIYRFEGNYDAVPAVAFWVQGDELKVRDLDSDERWSLPWGASDRVFGPSNEELLTIEPGEERIVLCFRPSASTRDLRLRRYRSGPRITMTRYDGRKVPVRCFEDVEGASVDLLWISEEGELLEFGSVRDGRIQLGFRLIRKEQR